MGGRSTRSIRIDGVTHSHLVSTRVEGHFDLHARECFWERTGSIVGKPIVEFDRFCQSGVWNRRSGRDGHVAWTRGEVAIKGLLDTFEQKFLFVQNRLIKGASRWVTLFVERSPIAYSEDVGPP